MNLILRFAMGDVASEACKSTSAPPQLLNLASRLPEAHEQPPLQGLTCSAPPQVEKCRPRAWPSSGAILGAPCSALFWTGITLYAPPSPLADRLRLLHSSMCSWLGNCLLNLWYHDGVLLPAAAERALRDTDRLYHTQHFERRQPLQWSCVIACSHGWCTPQYSSIHSNTARLSQVTKFASPNALACCCGSTRHAASRFKAYAAHASLSCCPSHGTPVCVTAWLSSACSSDSIRIWVMHDQVLSKLCKQLWTLNWARDALIISSKSDGVGVPAYGQ